MRSITNTTPLAMKSTAIVLLLLLPSAVFSQNVAVTATTLFEGEPTLAVHPTNSQRLAAAWIGVVLGQGAVIRTSTSSDGGLTWSSPIYIPHETNNDKSADPSLQFNNSGELFLCYIDYEGTNFTSGEIYVRKSTDNGTSWGNPVEVIADTDCPNKLCIDRPWMEVDRSGGPNDGTIYVTSMNADQPTLVSPPYNPFLSVSTDGGNSFGTPRYLDTTGYLAGSTISQPMPTPAIGADGTFYAAYPSYETSQSPFAHYYLASSTTQGVSLTHSNIYTVVMAGVTDPYAKKAGKLIADPSLANHLISINLSEDNGDVDIFFMETYDGITWTAPVRLNQDPVGNGKLQDLVWGEFNESGDLAICWRDRRNASSSGYQTETEIYGVVRYTDSVDFESDFPISSQQVNHDVILEGKGNDFMSVRFVGDTLYSVWGDVRTGTLNIYINRINVSTGTSSISEIWNEAAGSIIFPNPVAEELQLSEFDQSASYTIVDLSGKELRKITAAKTDVSTLGAGIYFVVRNSKSSTESFKFTKL